VAAYCAGYRTSVPLQLFHLVREAARLTALAAGDAAPTITAVGGPEVPAAIRTERGVQCGLLRDIYLHPSREVHVAPPVLQWNDATVVKLARGTYADRHLPSGLLDNARLAMLADALEEAGCDDAAILDHCRHPGEHVRGCWLVDLLLGKAEIA
jgi:hypothetical protein